MPQDSAQALPRHVLDPGIGMTERIVSLADGRRMRAVLGGSAPGPLVVFEAGMGAPAGSWIAVQRSVSARARTLSYDRAGYGGSDPDEHERTLARMVDDLTELLDQLDETVELILVGHSWGGPIIRLFADRHPERVAGIVFVDATVAEVITQTMAKRSAQLYQAMSWMARAHLTGVLKRIMLHGAKPGLTQADLDIIVRDVASVGALQAGCQEAAQIASSVPILRRLEATGTPRVPVVCMQAGRVDRGTAKLRPVFNQTAADLMAAAPRGRIVVVARSGHLIPQECPPAVTAEILAVIDDAARSSTAPVAD